MVHVHKCVGGLTYSDAYLRALKIRIECSVAVVLLLLLLLLCTCS